MTKQEIETLAEKYREKADKAYRNYQETGITRYDREYRNNDDLATALSMAAGNADGEEERVALRCTLASIASDAQQLVHDIDPKKLRSFLNEVITQARIRGLIRG